VIKLAIVKHVTINGKDKFIPLDKWEEFIEKGIEFIDHGNKKL
jgi:hypothetical protein